MTATAEVPSIANMSQTAKQSLLAALLRDLFRDGRGTASVEDPSGNYFVLQAPANARELEAESIRKMTPEGIAELERRANDPDEEFIDIDEMTRLLNSGAEFPTRR
jgi:hypothetical protein